MFSDVGRTLDQDTIEYAWLIEVQMGRLSGKLTTPQLFTVLSTIETLILLACDSENELNSLKDDALLSQPKMQQTAPPTQNLPQHVQQAIQQLLQPKSNVNPQKSGAQVASGNQAKNIQNAEKKNTHERKRSEENNKKVLRQNSNLNNVEEETKEQDMHALKYKMTRVAVDAIDFWLVESGAALQLWISPIRLANCNLHGKQVTSGLSCMIYTMSLRQTVWQPQKYNHSKYVHYTFLNHIIRKFLQQAESFGLLDLPSHHPLVLSFKLCHQHRLSRTFLVFLAFLDFLIRLHSVIFFINLVIASTYMSIPF